MNNVLFLLGAGASADCGAPLMNNFLDIATDLYVHNKVNEKKEHFERVFDAISKLQTVHSKSILDLNNIESVFTTFEMAKLIHKLPGYEKVEEIETIITSLKEVIVTTLQATIKFPTNNYKILPTQSYDLFGELLFNMTQDTMNKYNVSIATFNYDIALDFALMYYGFNIDYSLSKEEGKKPSINLLKLHGSLNWAITTDKKDITSLPVKEYVDTIRVFPNEKAIYLPIGNEMIDIFKKKKFEVEQEPVIIPPTWNKSDQYSSIQNVWIKAAEKLESADYLFIIGYSLPETDAFFKLLYGLGTVGNKILRKIVVINPDKFIEEKFKNLMGPGALARFVFIENTFAEGIDSLRKLLKVKKLKR